MLPRAAAALLIGLATIGCGAMPSVDNPVHPSLAQESRPSLARASTPEGAGEVTIERAVLDGVTEGTSARLVRAALKHKRTLTVHAGREFDVTEVSAVSGASFGAPGEYARVVIEFAQPLSPDVWPDELTCLVGRASNDITGIAWLLSLTTGTVEAYSPQWDRTIDCVAG